MLERDMEPYHNLCAAIIQQAIDELKSLYRAFKRRPDKRGLQAIEWSESWFRGDWCEELLHGVTTGGRVVYELRRRCKVDGDIQEYGRLLAVSAAEEEGGEDGGGTGGH